MGMANAYRLQKPYYNDTLHSQVLSWAAGHSRLVLHRHMPIIFMSDVAFRKDLFTVHTFNSDI